MPCGDCSNCPDIDLLCSPISYFDRGLGESAPAMTAAGERPRWPTRMWLFEDDTATYLSTGDCPGWTERVKGLAETNTQLVRNVAEEAMRNFGTWWMDLTGRRGGSTIPACGREMAKLKALDEAGSCAPPTPFRPEIAAIIDERSMMRLASGGQGRRRSRRVQGAGAAGTDRRGPTGSTCWMT